MREQSEKDFPDTEGKLPRTVLEYVTWQVRVQKKTTVCAQCPLRLQRVRTMAGVFEQRSSDAYHTLQDRIAAAAERNEILENEITFEYCEMVSKSADFAAAGKPEIYYCLSHQCYHSNDGGVFSTAEINTNNPKSRVCLRRIHSSVRVTQGRIDNGVASGSENMLGKKWFAKVLKLKFVETRIEEGVRRSSARGAPAVRTVRMLVCEPLCACTATVAAVAHTLCRFVARDILVRGGVLFMLVARARVLIECDCRHPAHR